MLLTQDGRMSIRIKDIVTMDKATGFNSEGVASYAIRVTLSNSSRRIDIGEYSTIKERDNVFEKLTHFIGSGSVLKVKEESETNVESSMFTMVLLNEIMDKVEDIDKINGILHIEGCYVDVVNRRLHDLGIFNQSSLINLKSIYGSEYKQEHMNYLFDDVWNSGRY